jgi:hypothetical protein
MRVLDAVDGQATPRELILVLQIRDNAMRHIFLLFSEEVVSHRVERVGSELVVSDDDLHHVQLNSALDINILALTCTQGLDVQCLIFDFGISIFQSSKQCIIVDHQMLSSVYHIWEIEVLSVVASNEIWVNFQDKVAPGDQ